MMNVRHNNTRLPGWRCRDRRGAFTVEFALTLPILLLFLLGCIEFGRANMIQGTIGNAAYEGVRKAIVPGATASDAKEAAQLMLDTGFIKGSTITLNPSVITDETPNVTMTISVDLDSNIWITPLFAGGIELSKSRTLVRERYTQDIHASFSGGSSSTEKSTGGKGVGGSRGKGGWGWW